MSAEALNPHSFLLRRLHSLLGIVPIGAFLVEHLITNSSIIFGDEEYQRDVDFIMSLPGLLLLEIFLIWVPIGLHGALGLVYTFSGRPNQNAYGYGANWRYSLMRLTGAIALIYIFFHVATTRWHWSFGGWYTPFDSERATVTTAEALQRYWWLPWFYLVGMLACVYHLANGLWTAAITWGLTVSVGAQRRWGYVCLVVGVLLTVMGVVSVVAFATYDLEPFMEAGLPSEAARME